MFSSYCRKVTWILLILVSLSQIVSSTFGNLTLDCHYNPPKDQQDKNQSFVVSPSTYIIAKYYYPPGLGIEFLMHWEAIKTRWHPRFQQYSMECVRMDESQVVQLSTNSVENDDESLICVSSGFQTHILTNYFDKFGAFANTRGGIYKGIPMKCKEKQNFIRELSWPVGTSNSGRTRFRNREHLIFQASNKTAKRAPTSNWYEDKGVWIPIIVKLIAIVLFITVTVVLTLYKYFQCLVTNAIN